MPNETPDPEIGPQVRPLYADGSSLYASRGLDVLVSRDGGDHFQHVATAPASVVERWVGRSRFLARIGRLGIHALRPVPNGGIVAVLRRRLAYRAPGETSFREVFRLERGHRPLGICLTPSGALYFGEYFANAEREAVHVYGSENGQHWSVVHSFSAGSIRHVHGIVADPYREGLWVLTGDDDEEAGLWFTDDAFATIERVAGGSQQARAVGVIPIASGLIVPTDTPREQNAIQHLDVQSGQFESLAPLPNSAFHAVRIGEGLFVSTVAEPSPVNDTRYAYVFASLNGYDWNCIARFERDLPWAKGWERYLRYPEIVLTPGAGTRKHVYAYGRAVQRVDARLMRWSIATVAQHLQAKASDR